MDVCILSMQRVQNFGSLLQSYALKRMLEERGCHVSFIDIVPNEEDQKLLEGSSSLVFHEGEPGGSIWSKLKKLDRYTLNRLRVKKLSKIQEQKFEDFRRDFLGINQNAQNDFDLCVIGSDEVFNCMSKTGWGFTSQLFGNVPQAKRVMFYAASCGSTKLEHLPPRVAQRISETFRNVSAFSVRDKNTAQFVAGLANIIPEEHLDPVAVANFSAELSTVELPKVCSEPYCVVYSYYNRISDPDEICQIQSFCRQRGLRILAVGAPQKWIRDYLVLDPFEMLNVFANADFVITDTFHGTIFSAKYAKRFAVLVRESNSNKLEDLVQRLSLQAHRITDIFELEKAYGVEKQERTLKVFLAEQQQKTISYLRENVSGEHNGKNQ